MAKHAYLIIAHNEFNLLKLLIKSLDDKRNDIFVMADAKAKNFNQKEFENINKHSKLTFVKRIANYWGAFSHTKAHFLLMEEAAKKCYDYYHIISGVDIPLKTQDEIHLFFDKNKGKEFVNISKISMNETYEQEKREIAESGIKKKFKYLSSIPHSKYAFFYFFNQKYLSRKHSSFFGKIIRKFGIFLFVLQQLFGIQRNKNLQIYKGSDWFSITHDLVVEIINKKQLIKKHFNFCFIPTELYVQTLIKNSDFAQNVYEDKSAEIIDFERENPYTFDKTIYEDTNMRHTDWKRGNPYIFLISDYDELINSDRLFARKFSTAVDKEIIKKLYCRLLPEELVKI